MTDDEKGSVGRSMGIAAVILSVSILLSRVLGFAREAVIAAAHGASQATDAYYAAFTLPDLMNYFLAGGTLSITFIPLFTSYVARGDEVGGWRLFSTVATTMGAALVFFTIVAELAAPWVVPLLVPGFDDPEQLALAIEMTRIVIPAQLCFYFGGLLQATLFTRKVFWPAAIAPLVYNLCIILFGIALDPVLGIRGFSIGVVVGALLGPLAIPLWAARREVRFKLRFAPRDPGFVHFLLLTLPLMLGVGLVTVDEWLLRYFGSQHAAGAITWLNNSRKLMLVVFAVIGQAAGQAALPFLTELYHKGEEDEMGRMLATSVGRVVFLAVIGAASLAVAAESIVWVVFRRGAFTAADAATTATLLVMFSLGLASWASQTMAVRGFYARKDTLVPMLVATGSVILALPIYWVLDDALGVVGLALATSIGMTINAIATIVVYRLRTGTLPLRPIIAALVRGLLFAAAGAGAAWATKFGLQQAMDIHDVWTHALVLVAQGAAFLVALVLVGALYQPPELRVVTDNVARKAKRVLARFSR